MATAWSRFRPIVSAWWQRPNLWLLLAVCGLLLYARRPDAFHNPQFWAEDGYFFERNHVVGATAIIQPYNGYLHLVPRLIAAVAGYADPAWIPACYVGAAFLLTLWVAAYTQSQRLHFRAAAGVALAVVLVPDCPDVLLNLPNLQSILGVGLLLLLISDDPDSPARLIHDVAVVVLLGLTGPFIIAFFPLFAWRAWKRRHRPASPSIAQHRPGRAGCRMCRDPDMDDHYSSPAAGSRSHDRRRLDFRRSRRAACWIFIRGSLRPKKHLRPGPGPSQCRHIDRRPPAGKTPPSPPDRVLCAPGGWFIPAAQRSVSRPPRPDRAGGRRIRVALFLRPPARSLVAAGRIGGWPKPAGLDRAFVARCCPVHESSPLAGAGPNGSSLGELCAQNSG